MKSFLIHPFEQRIHVTNDPDEFTRRYNSYAAKDELMLASELETNSGMAVRLEHPTKGVLFLLYLRPKAEDDVIYHEALHMVHFVMDYVSVPINEESTEIQVYMLMYIVVAVKRKLS